MYNFSIGLINNTNSKIRVPLFNAGGMRGVVNSNVEFSADLTGVDLNVPYIEITVSPNATGEVTIYKGVLEEKTPQGVVDALNKINVGLFWLQGSNTVVTSNSLFTYHSLIIGAPVVYNTWFTATVTAGATFDYDINTLSALELIADWGDGSPEETIPGGPGWFQFHHNYGGFPVANTVIKSSAPATQMARLSVLSSGAITSIDISALTSLVQINLSENGLTALDITSNTQLSAVNVINNNLTVAAVNDILIALDAAGHSAGSVNLSGQTPAAAPSGAGAVAAANLTGKGWLVITD